MHPLSKGLLRGKESKKHLALIANKANKAVRLSSLTTASDVCIAIMTVFTATSTYQCSDMARKDGLAADYCGL